MTYLQPHPSYRRPEGDPFGNIVAELIIMDFALTPLERGPNSYPVKFRVLDSISDKAFREVINDDVEVFIPVTWSLDSYLGFPRPSEFDVEREVETAHMIIESCALLEAERITTPQDPCRSTPYSYVDQLLRCSALNEVDFLRHGFLAVCRNGVALLGCSLLWEPLPIQNITNYRAATDAQQPSISAQHRHLNTQLPIGNPEYQTELLEYWSYQEISSVIPTELLRFDGLATLLYVAQSDYALQNETYRTFVSQYLNQPIPPVVQPGSVMPFYFPRNPLGDVHCAELFLEATDQMQNCEEFFKECFVHELGSRVLAGWMPVVGTGMTSNDEFRYNAFNSAIGIELTSESNGQRIFLESIFSELDLALAMIRERTQTSTPSEKTKVDTPDFVQQLQQLTSLRDSGALTAEEFSAAKARLLGNP